MRKLNLTALLALTFIAQAGYGSGMDLPDDGSAPVAATATMNLEDDDRSAAAASGGAAAAIPGATSEVPKEYLKKHLLPGAIDLLNECGVDENSTMQLLKTIHSMGDMGRDLFAVITKKTSPNPQYLESLQVAVLTGILDLNESIDSTPIIWLLNQVAKSNRLTPRFVNVALALTNSVDKKFRTSIITILGSVPQDKLTPEFTRGVQTLISGIDYGDRSAIRYISAIINSLSCVDKDRLTPDFVARVNALTARPENISFMIRLWGTLPETILTDDFVVHIQSLIDRVSGDEHKIEIIGALKKVSVDRLTPDFMYSVSNLAQDHPENISSMIRLRGTLPKTILGQLSTMDHIQRLIESVVGYPAKYRIIDALREVSGRLNYQLINRIEFLTTGLEDKGSMILALGTLPETLSDDSIIRIYYLVKDEYFFGYENKIIDVLNKVPADKLTDEFVTYVQTLTADVDYSQKIEIIQTLAKGIVDHPQFLNCARDLIVGLNRDNFYVLRDLPLYQLTDAFVALVNQLEEDEDINLSKAQIIRELKTVPKDEMVAFWEKFKELGRGQDRHYKIKLISSLAQFSLTYSLDGYCLPAELEIIRRDYTGASAAASARSSDMRIVAEEKKKGRVLTESAYCDKVGITYKEGTKFFNLLEKTRGEGFLTENFAEKAKQVLSMKSFKESLKVLRALLNAEKEGVLTTEVVEELRNTPVREETAFVNKIKSLVEKSASGAAAASGGAGGK